MPRGSTVLKERCECGGKSVEEWHRCCRSAQNIAAQSEVEEAKVPSETSHVRAEKDVALLMAFNLVAASECDEYDKSNTCPLKEVLDTHELLYVKSQSSTELWDALVPHRPAKAKGDSARLVID
ncbi:hypothetical protein GOBAR_AA22305 [Gossypium barbadense]|uniref:Uncharacterized protein n=1 Tax=Gossypium barbadense TaxID=3634 RepID=A0A2P5X4T2_GOSBA|nr:hypothetical protein GOBAR_AA22305 [Gossypium barbadense]